MFFRIATALFLTVLLSPASAAEPPASGPAATRPVQRINDVSEYLQKVRDTMNLAHNGGYGAIKKKDMERAVAAQSEIEQLLVDRTDGSSLTEDQLIRLANDQEVINSIIRADDKSRIVCTRLPSTGSRLPVKECMTVAEREYRAKQAMQNAHDDQINLGCERDASGQCAH